MSIKFNIMLQAAVEELSKLKLELSDIEKQEIEWKKKEEELNMKEKVLL